MAAEVRHSGSDWLTSDDTKKQFVTLYSTGPGHHLGLYGWRRRCLFFLFFLLTFFVIFNLALTLWILKVLQLSSDGLGPLQIHSNRIQLNGNSLLDDNLIVSKIKTEEGQRVQLEGRQEVRLTSKYQTDDLIDTENSLRLSHDVLDVNGPALRVWRDDGHTLFSADDKEIIYGLESLNVSVKTTTGIQEALQTSVIKTDPGEPLRLESVTRFVNILGGGGINLTSLGGEINITTLNDLKLHSKSGSIVLDADAIVFPYLETTNPSTARVPTAGGSLQATIGIQDPKSQAIVYQLCSCENGRIFLALPNGNCGIEVDFCR